MVFHLLGRKLQFKTEGAKGRERIGTWLSIHTEKIRKRLMRMPLEEIVDRKRKRRLPPRSLYAYLCVCSRRPVSSQSWWMGDGAMEGACWVWSKGVIISRKPMELRLSVLDFS